MIFNNLNTNLILEMTMAFTAGLILGAFYFTALWYTVRQMSSVKSPARLMIGSFVIRMAIILSGFYLIMGVGHWERLAVAMLGFIIIRKILTYLLGPQNAEQTFLAK